MLGKYRMISELKLNDFLKTDGQNCCVLLLGLRNDYHFQVLPYQQDVDETQEISFLGRSAPRLSLGKASSVIPHNQSQHTEWR
jgi:hypothetical protein